MKNIKTFVGEFDPALENDSFDVLFSVSVVEHIPNDRFESFLNDCIRILRPGGYMVHAIDMYVADQPTSFWLDRYQMFKDAVIKKDAVEPLGIVHEGPFWFTCDIASNPDKKLYGWKNLSPRFDLLRLSAPSVSLKVGVRKPVE